MYLQKKENLIILIFVTVKFLIHLLVAGNYELHRDALLYASLGEYPAWGFASVPPLISVIANFSRFIFGDTAFALRFFPAVAGALSIWLVIQMVRELKGGKFAMVLAGLSFLFSVAYLRTNSLFQPVAFNQFFWVLCFFLTIRLVRRKDPRYWIWIGITLGLAFLNKYSISFLALGLLLAVLISSQRNLIFNRFFVLGMVAGLLICLPNLIWQYQNNWPVMSHMSELRESQLVHVNLYDFLSMQLVMNIHALLVWIPGLIVFFTNKELKEFRFVSYTYVFVLLILIVLKGKAYYSLGLYPVLFSSGSVAIERWLKEKLSFLRYAVVLIIAAVSLPFIPFSLPVLQTPDLINYTRKMDKFIPEGILRWEDGELHELPQDYADMRGWKNLSEITVEAWNTLDSEEKMNATIFADNYAMAGAILFYAKDSGLPEPVSFDDNFLFHAPDSLDSEVIIFIDHDAWEMKDYCRELSLYKRVEDRYFREDGLGVFICKGPDKNLGNLYKKILSEERAKYERK